MTDNTRSRDLTAMTERVEWPERPDEDGVNVVGFAENNGDGGIAFGYMIREPGRSGLYGNRIVFDNIDGLRTAIDAVSGHTYRDQVIRELIDQHDGPGPRGYEFRHEYAMDLLRAKLATPPRPAPPTDGGHNEQ